MRGLQLADLDLVARALLLLPASNRASALHHILNAARLGAAHHAACGTAHPVHGTGTLMSAVSRLPIAPRPAVLRADDLDCLALVAITIRDLVDDTFDIGADTLSALQRTP